MPRIHIHDIPEKEFIEYFSSKNIDDEKRFSERYRPVMTPIKEPAMKLSSSNGAEYIYLPISTDPSDKRIISSIRLDATYSEQTSEAFPVYKIPANAMMAAAMHSKSFYKAFLEYKGIDGIFNLTPIIENGNFIDAIVDTTLDATLKEIKASDFDAKKYISENKGKLLSSMINCRYELKNAKTPYEDEGGKYIAVISQYGGAIGKLRLLEPFKTQKTNADGKYLFNDAYAGADGKIVAFANPALPTSFDRYHREMRKARSDDIFKKTLTSEGYVLEPVQANEKTNRIIVDHIVDGSKTRIVASYVLPHAYDISIKRLSGIKTKIKYIRGNSVDYGDIDQADQNDIAEFMKFMLEGGCDIHRIGTFSQAQKGWYIFAGVMTGGISLLTYGIPTDAVVQTPYDSGMAFSDFGFSEQVALFIWLYYAAKHFYNKEDAGGNDRFRSNMKRFDALLNANGTKYPDGDDSANISRMILTIMKMRSDGKPIHFFKTNDAQTQNEDGVGFDGCATMKELVQKIMQMAFNENDVTRLISKIIGIPMNEIVDQYNYICGDQKVQTKSFFYHFTTEYANSKSGIISGCVDKLERDHLIETSQIPVISGDRLSGVRVFPKNDMAVAKAKTNENEISFDDHTTAEIDDFISSRFASSDFVLKHKNALTNGGIYEISKKGYGESDTEIIIFDSSAPNVADLESGADDVRSASDVEKAIFGSPTDDDGTMTMNVSDHIKESAKLIKAILKTSKPTIGKYGLLVSGFIKISGEYYRYTAAKSSSGGTFSFTPIRFFLYGNNRKSAYSYFENISDKLTEKDNVIIGVREKNDDSDSVEIRYYRYTFEMTSDPKPVRLQKMDGSESDTTSDLKAATGFDGFRTFLSDYGLYRYNGATAAFRKNGAEYYETLRSAFIGCAEHLAGNHSNGRYKGIATSDAFELGCYVDSLLATLPGAVGGDETQNNGIGGNFIKSSDIVTAYRLKMNSAESKKQKAISADGFDDPDDESIENEIMRKTPFQRIADYETNASIPNEYSAKKKMKTDAFRRQMMETSISLTARNSSDFILPSAEKTKNAPRIVTLFLRFYTSFVMSDFGESNGIKASEADYRRDYESNFKGKIEGIVKRSDGVIWDHQASDSDGGSIIVFDGSSGDCQLMKTSIEAKRKSEGISS